MTARFDLAETPLEPGITLLEASAGTGKTFAITATFLRLLLEQKVSSLREILVVTFTRDATAELRGRLREGLLRAARVFAVPAGDPRAADELKKLAYLGALRERHPDGGAILERALRQFDELSVFTIHGFCRRVLDQQAFESGLPFRVEFVEDERDYLERAAWDFWRRHVPHAGIAVATCLVGDKVSPASLLASYREFRRYRKPRFVPPAAPWSTAENALHAALAGLRRDADPVRRGFGEITFKSDAWDGLDRRACEPGLMRWLHGDDAALPHALACARAAGKVYVRQKQAQAPAAIAAFEPVLAAMGEISRSLRARFCLTIREAFEAEKRRLGALDQNDLLEHVRKKLAGDAGPRFAAAIQQRWSVALVDEFQDTDPVQWDIFSTLFGNAGDEPESDADDDGPRAFRSLFMIGDPKQAIYSFRGADIYAYLEARVHALRAYSLRQNWRSHPALIETLNGIWGRLDDPFVHRAIHYERVEAGREDLPTLTVDGHSHPVELWVVEHDSAPELENAIQLRIAHECVHLLERGRIGTEAVRPEDIAILVRANRDAEPIQARLREAGIPSVIGKAGELADTTEARELGILLLAIAHPENAPRVRAARGTRLVGGTADDLMRPVAEDAVEDAGTEADGDDAFASQLDRSRRRWAQMGATPAIEWLLRRLRVRDRLLGEADGLRRVTNLEQVLEWVHRRAQEGDDSPEAIARWFQRNLVESDVDEERREMRPEAHGGAVRILTVHRAKGLEYPIVFSPYLHRGPKAPTGDFSLHDDAGAVLFVTDKDKGKKARHRDQELGEAMRLAYVAFTRPVHRLYTVLPVGNKRKGVAGSAAGWFWLGPERAHSPEADPRTDVEGWLVEAMKRIVSVRAADLAHPGVRALDIDAKEVDGRLPRWSATAEQSWAVAREAPAVPHPWTIESFSSLSRGRSGTAEPFAESPARTDVDTGSGTGSGILGFARGARAGTALHHVLERVDLTATDGERTRATVQSLLRLHGLADPGAHPRCPDPVQTVVDNLRTLAATPWPAGGGAVFGDVGKGSRLDEWEFHLPLGAMRPRSLARLFSKSADPAEQAYAPHLRQLGTVPVRGFLTGSVDMVAEVDGRFWVVDWKSNFLGPEPSDYAPRALTESMFAHHYALQGQLYLAALRAYLRQRLGEGAGDAIGGMVYVFLRGLDGEGGGIWTHAPSEGLAASLDAMLRDSNDEEADA